VNLHVHFSQPGPFIWLVRMRPPPLLHPRVLQPVLTLVCGSMLMNPWNARSVISLAPSSYQTHFSRGPPPSTRPPVLGFVPFLLSLGLFHTPVCGFH
jgi:hypothetical protein